MSDTGDCGCEDSAALRRELAAAKMRLDLVSAALQFHRDQGDDRGVGLENGVAAAIAPGQSGRTDADEKLRRVAAIIADYAPNGPGFDCDIVGAIAEILEEP